MNKVAQASTLRASRRASWKLALPLLLATCASSLGAPPLEEVVEKTYAFTSEAMLSVRNTDGTVSIYGSEKAELKIVARKKAYSQARLDGIAINVAINGDSVVIDTIYPPKPKGWSFADRSGTVDYTIIVPQTCTLSQVEVGDGEIIIQGMHGPALNASLTNGRILMQDCFSLAHLQIENGGIDVLHGWWEEKPFSLLAEIRNGDVGLVLPKTAAATIDAATMSGWVRNGFGEKDAQDAGKKLNVTVGTEPSAELKLRSGSGNIRIQKN